MEPNIIKLAQASHVAARTRLESKAGLSAAVFPLNTFQPDLFISYYMVYFESLMLKAGV